MQRLFAEYGPLHPDACWIWPGATIGKVDHRYGHVQTGSRSDGTRKARLTHVLMWEAVNGPVPEGKELHHRCMTPLCCNPRCLKPVPHQENCTLVTEETKQQRRDNLAYGREVYVGMRA